MVDRFAIMLRIPLVKSGPYWNWWQWHDTNLHRDLATWTSWGGLGTVKQRWTGTFGGDNDVFSNEYLRYYDGRNQVDDGWIENHYHNYQNYDEDLFTSGCGDSYAVHLLCFLTNRFLDGEACLLLLNLVRGKFKMWGMRKRTRDLADRQTDTQTYRMTEEVGTLHTDTGLVKMRSRLGTQFMAFFRLIARISMFRDKKYRILTFRDKKYRI